MPSGDSSPAERALSASCKWHLTGSCPAAALAILWLVPDVNAVVCLVVALAMGLLGEWGGDVFLRLPADGRPLFTLVRANRAYATIAAWLVGETLAPAFLAGALPLINTNEWAQAACLCYLASILISHATVWAAHVRSYISVPRAPAVAAAVGPVLSVPIFIAVLPDSWDVAAIFGAVMGAITCTLSSRRLAAALEMVRPLLDDGNMFIPTAVVALSCTRKSLARRLEAAAQQEMPRPGADLDLAEHGAVDDSTKLPQAQQPLLPSDKPGA